MLGSTHRASTSPTQYRPRARARAHTHTHTHARTHAGYLSEVQRIAGPFLVVVPLSTVPNWAREFRKWAPQLNTVIYVGDAASREVIRQYEFPAGRGTGRQYRFDALVTTYEMVIKDAALLRQASGLLFGGFDEALPFGALMGYCPCGYCACGSHFYL